MKMHVNSIRVFALLVAVFGLASGCASGSRMLDEPVPLETGKAVAVSSDAHLDVALDWVIVRDGPGTWARNVDWDEYKLTVKNLSDETVIVSDVRLTDSLGVPVTRELDRKALVKQSRKTVKRYASSNLNVEAGASSETLIASGGVTMVAGGAVAAYSLTGALVSALTGGSGAVGTAGAAATGAIVAGPVLAVSGMVKASRNKAVNREIQRRRTPLPVQLEPGEEKTVTVFFPLAPSPTLLTLNYATNEQTRSQDMDLSTVLKGIHLTE